MAYCNRCGAYIPDGQDMCLACGFDPAAETARQNAAAAAAAAFAQKSEEDIRAEEAARARAEKHRRDQQEMHRKWAETEARRRQMEEEFRRRQAEDEQHRREQEEQLRFTSSTGSYSRLHRTGTRAAGDNTSGTTRDKTFAYLSYISFLCFLPSLLGVNDYFTQFHARQGRKLFWISLLLSWIPGVNAIAWLFQVVLAVMGMKNVANGTQDELPVIGHIGEDR